MATATADLGFTIRDLGNGLHQKIRDDGRKGYTVADEAKLWDALQVSRAETAQLREQIAALTTDEQQPSGDAGTGEASKRKGGKR